MGNQRGDDRYGGGNRSGGDDRWRDRDPSRNYGGSGGDWGGGRPRGDDDRGFFERAGEQVRSWFGDDDDERGRGGGRSERGSYGRGGSDSFGGGWGNQQGESWNRDRPGVTSGGSSPDYGNDWGSGDRSRSGQGGYAEGYQRSGGGSDRFEGSFGQESRAGETWGGSGFGGGTDQGRRFDRIDAGSTGSHGAHPMSSPVGGAYGAGYGASSSGGSGSSARTAAMLGGGRGAASGASDGSREGGFGGGRGGGIHDPHYSEWRNRQIEQLDRDYDEYRREHQSKFEQEFGGWREKRQGQRSSLGRVTEHMEVLGSDGQHIGTVDTVRGDRIILTKSDENAGGRHHSIPCSWIESVDDKVRVDKSAEEAMNAWRDEERNQALFERDDQGSEGPHMLNRSFSGTYRDRDE